MARSCSMTLCCLFHGVGEGCILPGREGETCENVTSEQQTMNTCLYTNMYFVTPGRVTSVLGAAWWGGLALVGFVLKIYLCKTKGQLGARQAEPGGRAS